MFYLTGLSKSISAIALTLLLMSRFRFYTLKTTLYDSTEIVQFKYQT